MSGKSRIMLFEFSILRAQAIHEKVCTKYRIQQMKGTTLSQCDLVRLRILYFLGFGSVVKLYILPEFVLVV